MFYFIFNSWYVSRRYIFYLINLSVETTPVSLLVPNNITHATGGYHPHSHTTKVIN